MSLQEEIREIFDTGGKAGDMSLEVKVMCFEDGGNSQKSRNADN